MYSACTCISYSVNRRFFQPLRVFPIYFLQFYLLLEATRTHQYIDSKFSQLAVIVYQYNDINITSYQLLHAHVYNYYYYNCSYFLFLQESHAKAENCLLFLSTLSEPCTELANAEPKKIPSLLPRLLNTFRVIWMNSDHYQSRDRLTTLLSKVTPSPQKKKKRKTMNQKYCSLGARGSDKY